MREWVSVRVIWSCKHKLTTSNTRILKHPSTIQPNQIIKTQENYLTYWKETPEKQSKLDERCTETEQPYSDYRNGQILTALAVYMTCIIYSMSQKENWFVHLSSLSNPKLTQGKTLRNVSSSKTRLRNKGREGAGLNSLDDDWHLCRWTVSGMGSWEMESKRTF